MNLKRHPVTRHSSLVTRHSPFPIPHFAFCIVAVAAFAATATAANFTLTVSSADATKGSVSAVGGTYPEGTAVTVTATPEAGWTFTRWDGVVPSLRLDNPLVLPVTNDTTVTAVFGKTYYVATTGSDSTADGTDPSTPYLTIEKAYTAAADNDTVSVGPGTFVGTAAITVTKAVVIRGAGMDRTIRSKRSHTINNANAIIADMRLYGQTWGTMVTFTSGGAGGTLLRCDVSGNAYSSPTCGIVCYVGNIVGCVVTNNVNESGANGVAFNICGGPTLVEDCLIADNSTGYSGEAAGIYVNYNDTTYGKPTIIRHCTIVRNDGGNANGSGGFKVATGNFRLIVEGCVIGDNYKLAAATATATDDVSLYANNNNSGNRVFRDTVIARMAKPDRPVAFTFENCVTNVAAGFADPWHHDFSVARRSPAWGLCADGSDAGCVQSVHSDAFDIGCYALTNAAVGNLATPLVAMAENAPDPTNVVFDWDLDGDDVFETTGPVANAVWTTPGRHGVTVRATSGGESVTRAVEGVGYVAPRELFVWTQSPSPAFPYATWETAAHTPHAAVDAAIAGCAVQMTNEAFTVSKMIRIFKPIEFRGTGRDNDSVIGKVSGFTVTYRTDATATGTSIQRPATGGDIIPLSITAHNALVHSMALGPGRSRVVNVCAPDAVLSNCTVRFGEYTSGQGIGVNALGGLVTHCVISNNYNYNTANGGEVYLGATFGAATLRNCLVTGGRHTSTTGTGEKGAVYASAGCTVENCTIVGNQAGTGGGLYSTGAAIIRNNIIRDNESLCDSSSTGKPDWYDETGTAIYSNNCLPVAHNEGDGTVTDDPAFIYENGRNTFTFAAGSKCRDKGALLGWMDAGSVDLFGNARVQGEAPDIGCFEADMSQMTCDVAADPASAFGATNIALSAVIVGGSLSGDVAYLWDFDGDGTTDATGAVVTNRFEEGRHSVTLTVTVDGDTRFEVEKPDCVTIYPRVMYLAAANADPVYPYNTRAGAAANIVDVLALAQDGAEIIVLEGVHQTASQVLVNKAITLRADDGLAERPTIRRTGGTFSEFLVVNHPDALVEGIAFDHNRYGITAISIGADGGTVRNCVSKNSWYTSGGGLGLIMTGGLFDRGVVSGHEANTGNSDYYARGLAVRLEGDAICRNTLIRRNICTDRSGGKPGVVYVAGDARLENCTIVSNTCGNVPAVYCANTTAGGAVVNNIISGNYFGTPATTTYDGGFDWYIAPSASGIAWSNNCTSAAWQAGDATVVDDPLFSDAVHGDYTLQRNSPCRNKGVRRDWMDGALDLYGNPRVRGRPDIGAAEFSGRDWTTIMLR